MIEHIYCVQLLWFVCEFRLSHLESCLLSSVQWRTMSKEQCATYFHEAEQLSTLHKLKYPNWSYQINYVSIRTYKYA